MLDYYIIMMHNYYTINILTDGRNRRKNTYILKLNYLNIKIYKIIQDIKIVGFDFSYLNKINEILIVLNIVHLEYKYILFQNAYFTTLIIMNVQCSQSVTV